MPRNAFTLNADLFVKGLKDELLVSEVKESQLDLVKYVGKGCICWKISMKTFCSFT